jgi:protein-S-isoprenylcysteine O-methyltransferase Ste14
MGAGLISNSLIFMVVVVPLFCFIYQAIVLAEENYLRNKFGDQFTAYCSRVNRWIPNLHGLLHTITSMQFDWKRYMLKEYNTIYMLFLWIYILMMVFVPPLFNLDLASKIRISSIVVGSLSLFYLFIRYLKKTKRLSTKPTMGS